MKKAVTVVLMKSGLVLGVTRKDDHTDYGLIGGSIESYDRDLYAAAVREAKEETGLDIFNLELINAEIWNGVMEHTFIAEFVGSIKVDKEVETGLVRWVPFIELMNGSFGAYNTKIRKILPEFGLTCFI